MSAPAPRASARCAGGAGGACDACGACAGLWPTLYCMALNFPVRAKETSESWQRARAFALFLACAWALLPCPAPKRALARALRGRTAEPPGRELERHFRTRESACRLVHRAECEWVRAAMEPPVRLHSLADRCGHFESRVRVAGGAPPRAGPSDAEWVFARAHCTDRGMRSAVWGPPLWLLLYALERSAHRRPLAWERLWTECLGRILPCSLCRDRYTRETLPEVVLPYFRRWRHRRGVAVGPKGRPSLVREAHQAVRVKVSHSELAPRNWLERHLYQAARALND